MSDAINMQQVAFHWFMMDSAELEAFKETKQRSLPDDHPKLLAALHKRLDTQHRKAKPSPPDAIVPLDKGDMLYGKPGRYEIVRVSGQREFIRDGRTVRIIRPDGAEVVLHEVQEVNDAHASA
jgi:hypothetical protein